MPASTTGGRVVLGVVHVDCTWDSDGHLTVVTPKDCWRGAKVRCLVRGVSCCEGHLECAVIYDRNGDLRLATGRCTHPDSLDECDAAGNEPAGGDHDRS